MSSSRTARRHAESVSTGNVPIASVTPRDLLALLDARELEDVIDAGFRVAQRVVRCSFASAFYRTSKKGLLKERDSRGIEYPPAFMQRATEVNPAIPLALANPGVRILTTRDVIREPESQVRASAFYRDVMQPQGWRHAVALCFWSEPVGELPVFVLSVYRTEGSADFGRSDLRQLEGIYPLIASAVTRLHEREKTQSLRDGMAMTGRDGNRGLAVLDSHLRLIEANPVARRLAAAWDVVSPRRTGSTAVPTWTLPSQLAAECAAMRGEWERRLAADPAAPALRRRTIVHDRIKSLTASLCMVCRNTTALSEPTFVLELEQRAPRVTRKVRRDTSLLHQMTEAERSVAAALMEGSSNQEIADRLGKSVYAVKFLLHRIYQKTGVGGRAALIARLRG